jgi:hypothetical protein
MAGVGTEVSITDHTPFNIANVTLFIGISIFEFKKEFIV